VNLPNRQGRPFLAHENFVGKLLATPQECGATFRQVSLKPLQSLIVQQSHPFFPTLPSHPHQFLSEIDVVEPQVGNL
jgi:hypothetical protein